MRVFIAWVGAFLLFWVTLVAAGSLWQTVAAHWPIAVAMAVGSYFGGSTPLAGGTVGFPVLVLLLDETARLGRDFSLAIQSVGMVSATILIFARRTPLEGTLLKWTLAGSLVGAPLGAAFIVPHVNELTVALLFAVIWGSFGLMHLAKLREIVRAEGMSGVPAPLGREVGLLVGLIGGVVAAIIGMGIDMLIYVVLVLLYRADLKVAVPTSVVVMAITSVTALVSHLALGQVNPEVFGHWIAAAPVVLLGAPLGAWMVSLIPRTPTLLIVSTLCIGQFVWMCVRLRVWGVTLVVAITCILMLMAVFQGMYLAGKRFGHRRGPPSYQIDSLRPPIR